MSRTSATPASSPKPKVFRLPPAAPSQPLKPEPKRGSGRAWGWAIALLLLGLVWPLTAAFLSGDKNASDPELQGILPPPVSDAQAAVSEKSSTIMLRGQSEAIIGQMAKIPAGNEPIIETQAVTTVDNNTARELLSIISKY